MQVDITLFHEFMQKNNFKLKVVKSYDEYGENFDMGVYLLPIESEVFWSDDVRREGILVHSE